MPLYPQGGGLYPDSISNDLLADMPAGTLKGRAIGTGTGNPVDLTAAQAQAIMSGAPWSYRNILGRNGGFEVWQRGAGGSAAFGVAASSALYTADGWYFYNGAQGSYVAQGTPLTSGSRYCLQAQRSNGQTGVGTTYLEFPLDTDEIAQARGQTVTLSLTLQAGANWSPASGNLTIELYTGTGVAARRTSGAYSGEVKPISVVQAITATATRYSFTSSVVVPANAAQASLMMNWTPVGTAGAADYVLIDDVQLEIGSVATPFERRPFEQELAACRRHYFKTFPYSIAPAQAWGFTGCVRFAQVTTPSFAGEYGTWSFPVPMRITPIITTFSPSAANNLPYNAITGTHYSALTTTPGEWGLALSATSPAASAAGNVSVIHYTADAGI